MKTTTALRQTHPTWIVKIPRFNQTSLQEASKKTNKPYSTHPGEVYHSRDRSWGRKQKGGCSSSV